MHLLMAIKILRLLNAPLHLIFFGIIHKRFSKPEKLLNFIGQTSNICFSHQHPS
jgi:hypothetical protein